MRTEPFTRPTILAAVELLNRLTQAAFNLMALRLALESEIPDDTAVSVGKKCGTLGRLVMQYGARIVQTVDGQASLAEAVVREAVRVTHPNRVDDGQEAFRRGLARDGYVIEWEEYGQSPPRLRAALPAEIHLPDADDEVHELLKYYRFADPLGHLDQAVEAHTRGDWAAANGQIRTFMESLLDEIARTIDPAEAATLASAENRRAFLARRGFLFEDSAEWSQDGKNFVNGLMKMLHTHGAHPGLSDEEHSTFRLHLVLVTAHTLLRRLRYDGRSA
jgi:hypothetical protein